MIEDIKTFYPTADLLKDSIYCYYLIEGDSPQFKSIHYSFPHVYNAVSIYNSASFSYTHHLKVTGNANSSPLCLLQGKRQSPLLVELEGQFCRITILFKPLGLNNFINVDLNTLIGEDPAAFNVWDSERFSQSIGQIFSYPNLHDRITFLEQFLCSIYKPLGLQMLHRALRYLDDFTQELPVEEIASLTNTSLRSFNRLFKKHIGVSPVTYRRIARFRYSLEDKLFSEQFKKLTEIGYNSNFYDQSYFIKLYKQLSGTNPTAFFNSLKQLGDTKLVFQFINE
jgi:AraC-like DNA-binding protein